MMTLINNIIQYSLFLVLVTVIIFSTQNKNNSNYLNFMKPEKIRNKINTNNLPLKKTIIISFQLMIWILNIFSNMYWVLVLILHIIICTGFLSKNNKKNKTLNNKFNIKEIILIIIIFTQLLFICWQIQNILFAKNNNLFLLLTFYNIFFFISYKVFNQIFLISNYLIFNTCKILFTKKCNNFYFSQKKIFKFYSKSQAISNLWNFDSLKKSKDSKVAAKEKYQKIIKKNWIIFIIAWNNLLCKNIIKTQQIIINGWKSILTE